MADHKPIAFGGAPLHQLLATSLPQLTALVVARLVERVDVYSTLPAEQLTGDIAHVVTQAVRAFVQILRTGEMPPPEHVVEIRESAARRAEEGLPIDAVIGAFHHGAQACLDFVQPAVRPDETDAVFTAHRLLFDYLRLATGAVAAGYLTERQSMFGEEHAARQTLLAALVDGGPVEEVAARAGIRLPESYLVLTLSIGRHPDETADGVDPVVAARRKLRRLRTELDRRSGVPALSMLTSDGGLALVPHRPDRDWLDTLVAALAKAAGAGVVAGAEIAEPGAVPAAARLTGELCEVARIYDRPTGAYRLSDLLLEYQLTRPSPARDRLAALLRPAADKPDLLPTLRVFLDTGLNRRLTASTLRVHPNTVDYRLRRVAALTGLQVSRHENLLAIRAALAALDAANTRQPRHP